MSVTLRAATAEHMRAVAEIWHLGWIDGHLGHVPQELVDARTAESFHTRAPERVADTTVALVADHAVSTDPVSTDAAAAADDTAIAGEVAGFVMVVGDEVEQVYVSAAHRGSGIADALLDESERLVAAAGHRIAWLAVVAGNARARRFYEKRGWSDAGLFDYGAPSESGAKGAISVPCHRYEKSVR